jgi:PKD repeat protein
MDTETPSMKKYFVLFLLVVVLISVASANDGMTGQMGEVGYIPLNTYCSAIYDNTLYNCEGTDVYTYALPVGVDLTTVTHQNSTSHFSTSSPISAINATGNYLYVLGGSKFIIADITTRTIPTIIGTLSNTTYPYGTYGALGINGNVAYAAGTDSLYTIDITTKSNPIFLNSTNVWNGVSLKSAIVDGNYLYTVSYASQHLYIWDISTPKSPSLLLDYDTGAIEHSEGKPNYLSGAAYKNNTLYIANFRESLMTYNITDRTAPVKINETSLIDDDAPNNQPAVALSAFGDNLYVSCRYHSYDYYPTGGMAIYNITQPIPQYLGHNATSTGYAEGIATNGNITSVATTTAGNNLYNTTTKNDPVYKNKLRVPSAVFSFDSGTIGSKKVLVYSGRNIGNWYYNITDPRVSPFNGAIAEFAIDGAGARSYQVSLVGNTSWSSQGASGGGTYKVNMTGYESNPYNLNYTKWDIGNNTYGWYVNDTRMYKDARIDDYGAYFQVWNVTNKLNDPTMISSTLSIVNGTGMGEADVMLPYHGHYLISQNGSHVYNGLVIINISSEAAPTVKQSFGASRLNYHSIYYNASSDILYAVIWDLSTGTNYVTAMDMSNIDNIHYLGNYTLGSMTPYVLTANGTDVFVGGNGLYNIWKLDYSNPAIPTVNDFAYTYLGSVTNALHYRDGYLYVGDEARLTIYKDNQTATSGGGGVSSNSVTVKAVYSQQMCHNAEDAAFLAIRAMSGNYAEHNLKLIDQASTTPSNHAVLCRDGITWDTSSIPDDATVTNVNVTLNAYSSNDVGLGDLYVDYVDFQPGVSNTRSYGAGDFDYTKWGTTAWNTTKQSAIGTGYKSYNLSSSSYSRINITGDTVLGFRFANDTQGVAPSTWGSGLYSLVWWWKESDSGSEPIMTITYTNTSAPVANFSGTPRTGYAPLNVSFTDLSTGSPTFWIWAEGAAPFSNDQNPSRTFATPGNYSISLTAFNTYGSDTEMKSDYIIVSTPPTPPVVGTPSSQKYSLVMLLHGNFEAPLYSTSDFFDSSHYFAVGQKSACTGTCVVNINSTNTKFGNGSMFAQPIGDIVYPDAPQYTFGTNNFSVSGWVYIPVGSAFNTRLFNHTAGTNYDILSVDSSQQFSFNRYRSGVSIGSCVAAFGTPKIVTGQWNHLAFIQNSTYGTLYLNGSALTSCARTSSMTDIAGPVYINTIISGTSNSHVDELQVFNGGINQTIEYLYNNGEYPMYLNGTFGGYADDDYTKSLLHMDGSNGGTYFRDEAVNRTWTATSVTTNTTPYKFGPSSGWFYNTGSKLVGTNNGDFNAGANDFTLDFWYTQFVPSIGVNTVFASNSSLAYNGLMIAEYNGHMYAWASSTGAASVWDILNIFDLGTIDSAGTWTHFALVRHGNDFYGYKNGHVTSSISSGLSIFPGYSSVCIGACGGRTGSLSGIDEFRYSNVARWFASDFTTPTYAYALTTPTTFIATPSALSGPGAVQFNDTTLDSTWTNNSFLWYFGDGGASDSRNPTHTYTSTGVYTVTENVYNNNMTASISGIYNVGAPVVDFTGTPTTGTAAMLVTFTDLTTNTTPITSYLMDFGDGYSATTAPPWTHVYASFGSYSVNLTETNSVGTAYKYKRDYIVTSTNQNQQNTWWTPHTVQVTVMDTYGQRLYDVIINATFNQSAMPDAWITQMYGIQAGPSADLLNSNLTMHGETGSDGTVTFTMLGSLKYDFYLSAVAYGLNNYHVSAYPSDSMLNIYVTPPGQYLPTNANSTYIGLNGTSVYFTEPNNSYISMCIDYIDSTGSTTSVTNRWTFSQNGTLMNTSTFNPGSAKITQCYTAPNLRGVSYWWGYNGTRNLP